MYNVIGFVLLEWVECKVLLCLIVCMRVCVCIDQVGECDGIELPICGIRSRS
jgi:hypothetical protein